MSKYLWVGRTFIGNEQSIDDGEHVDQYAWNKNGNWKKFSQLNNGGLGWVDTFDIPGPNDQVVVGYDGTNSTPGWIQARSPLLFGGFSGTVAGGSWHSGFSGSGTTFTSSLSTFVFNQGSDTATHPQTGQKLMYPFPFLGGGITGIILDWVATRDNLPTYVYDQIYSTTQRNPSDNLNLKVTYTTNLITTFSYTLADGGITQPSEINADNRLMIDLSFVKSLVTGSTGSTGSTGGPIVYSQLTYNNPQVGPQYSGNLTAVPPTSGLRIRNGSFDRINLMPPATYYVTTIQDYRNYTDYGVYLYNVTSRDVIASNRQYMQFSGCTFARVNLNQYGWYSVPEASENNPSNNVFYRQAIPTEIASNFNAAYVFNDLFGVTSSSQVPSEYQSGILILTETPVRCYGNVSSGIPAVVYNVNNRAHEGITFAYDHSQNVVLGYKNENIIITVPTIEMRTPSSGYHYMPWAVEYAGAVVSTTVTNNAGFVRSNADIERGKTVVTRQLNLANHAVMDFSNNSELFDDWRFGGISGNTVVGGIVFSDETGKVLGSEGIRLWNTQTKAQVYEARLTTETLG